MRVKLVSLRDFRNYDQTSVSLTPGKNILIGENAQGKSNFLEAIELASFAASSRTNHDSELIRWKQPSMLIDVVFERAGSEESISIALAHPTKAGARSLDKTVKINGVLQSSLRSVLGKLVAVMFTAQDLNLLRGGPKFRRDWLDGVALRVKPAAQDIFSKYGKVVSQRNKLLKDIFERGKVTVSDQDQLLAWDRQLAHYGAQIIKLRVKLLLDLLPLAADRHEYISGERELLHADYQFRAKETESDESEEQANLSMSMSTINEMSIEELAATIMRMLKERRFEEIGRKQTVIGPHRDDVSFKLNEADAITYASQGQQRSLVLSLKLAELQRISEHLDEPPVLLLDDVLAELDVMRQGLLMSAVRPDMQTIITTTHLSEFKPEWIDGASIFNVQGGSVREMSRLA
jgi:DNA replication and repair protein RecF